MNDIKPTTEVVVVQITIHVLGPVTAEELRSMENLTVDDIDGCLHAEARTIGRAFLTDEEI